MDEFDPGSLAEGVAFAKAVATWLLDRSMISGREPLAWSRDQRWNGVGCTYTLTLGQGRIDIKDTGTGSVRWGLQIFGPDDNVVGSLWSSDQHSLAGRLYNTAAAEQNLAAIPTRTRIATDLESM